MKDEDGLELEPKQTLAFWRVLQTAAAHVQSHGREEVDSGNVIAAILRERDSQAVYLLQEQGSRSSRCHSLPLPWRDQRRPTQAW